MFYAGTVLKERSSQLVFSFYKVSFQKSQVNLGLFLIHRIIIVYDQKEKYFSAHRDFF
jgi:hypothetical protein